MDTTVASGIDWRSRSEICRYSSSVASSVWLGVASAPDVVHDHGR
jgi:hypothetical protein